MLLEIALLASYKQQSNLLPNNHPKTYDDYLTHLIKKIRQTYWEMHNFPL